MIKSNELECIEATIPTKGSIAETYVEYGTTAAYLQFIKYYRAKYK